VIGVAAPAMRLTSIGKRDEGGQRHPAIAKGIVALSWRPWLYVLSGIAFCNTCQRPPHATSNRRVRPSGISTSYSDSLGRIGASQPSHVTPEPGPPHIFTGSSVGNMPDQSLSVIRRDGAGAYHRSLGDFFSHAPKDEVSRAELPLNREGSRGPTCVPRDFGWRSKRAWLARGIRGALGAFVDEHRRCGVLDGGVDDGYVWLQCSCGGLIMQPEKEPPSVAPAQT